MKIKHIFISILAILTSSVASAQEENASAYFMDGYSMRHELNPAFGGERNYISIPALGNLGVGLNSNVGINTFLYKLPGTDRLTTFMSPEVSADEFLGKLENTNKINASVRLTILSAGFKGLRGYNTISLAARSKNGVTLPHELFEFMKLGQQGTESTYHMDDINIRSTNLAEIAIGHSHHIGKKIEVGAKLKLLMGLADVNARVDRLNVTMGDTRWKVDAQGSMDIAAGKGLEVPTNAEAGKELDKPEMRNQIAWGDIKYNNFNPSGFGFGVDLGVCWRPIKRLTLSASLTDLGFVNWKHNITAATPNTTWEFDGFQNVALDSSQPGYEDNKLKTQLDNIWDGLKDCANFQRTSTDGSRTQSLGATLRLGAEYQMPFYKGLTAGFLFTHQFDGPFSWNEGRLSANLKPAKWFDCNINVAQSTYGTSMGWMLNFHPRGFNFFVGSDHQFFKITPQFIPVGRANASINLGFNITFG